MTTRYDDNLSTFEKPNPIHSRFVLYQVEPEKPKISDAMRARLLAEASTGLDADKKQTNVILYIIIGVAALVLLGGQGIFY